MTKSKQRYVCVCQEIDCMYAEITEHKRLYCRRCASEDIISEEIDEDDSPFLDAT